MRHTERDWHERAAINLAAAYAVSGFSTNPVNARATSPAACKRNVYVRNAVGKFVCRGAASRRPSSARSSSSNTQALVRHCSAASRGVSLAAPERQRNCAGVWVENSGFASEFQRRREDIARRRRAMVTRGVGLRGTGAVDFEALDDENQRLKQALNRATEENRRCRVYSARLEEELLRSDGKVEVLLAELEQAPGMRNQRLVSDARCEIEKCAVVRTLVKQRGHLQQILAARNREIENLKRTQESSALAEMTAAIEEYFLETQRLRNLLARQQFGLASFPISPNEHCTGDGDNTSAQLEKKISEGDDGQRPTLQNNRDYVDTGWGRTAEALDRWDRTYSPLSKSDKDALQSQGMVARSRMRGGRDGGEGYTKNPIQTQHRRVRAATDRVVAQEILDAEMRDEFDTPKFGRRNRPVSPVARRSPPRAAQMAPRAERGMSSRNKIWSRQRKNVPKSHLRQRPGRQDVVEKRHPSSGNLAAEGGFSSDDAARNVTTMKQAKIRGKTSSGCRARPLSAPSRRRDSDVEECSPRSKKAQTPWGRSSNRTLSPWTGGNRNDGEGTSNSAPIARGATVGSMLTPKSGKGSPVDLKLKWKIIRDGEHQDFVQDEDSAESDRADANVNLSSVSNFTTTRGDGSNTASPVRNDVYSSVLAHDSKKSEERRERESISSERVRMQARKVGTKTSGGDSDEAGNDRDRNCVQQEVSGKRSSTTNDSRDSRGESCGAWAEEIRAPLVPREDSVDSRNRQPSPSHHSREPDTPSRGGQQNSNGSDAFDASSSVAEGTPYTTSSGGTVGQRGVKNFSGDSVDEIQSASSLQSQGRKKRATSDDRGSRDFGANVLYNESVSMDNRGSEPGGQVSRIESTEPADKNSSIAETTAISILDRDRDVVGSAFESVSNDDDGGRRRGDDPELGMCEDDMVVTPDMEQSSYQSYVDEGGEDAAFPVPSVGKGDYQELGEGDDDGRRNSTSQPSSPELVLAATEHMLPSSSVSDKTGEEGTGDLQHRDGSSTVGQDKQHTPPEREATFDDGADYSLSATDSVGSRRALVVEDGDDIEYARRAESLNGEGPTFEGGNHSGTARSGSYSGSAASPPSSVERSDEKRDDTGEAEAASIVASKKGGGLRSQDVGDEYDDDFAGSEAGGDEYGDDFE